MYCINLHLRRNGKDIIQLLDEEEDQHNQSHLIPDMVPQFLGGISFSFNDHLINTFRKISMEFPVGGHSEWPLP